jgi:hypothetical protein
MMPGTMIGSETMVRTVSPNRQLVARQRVGGGNAEQKGCKRAADRQEYRHHEAVAETLDSEDLEDPLEREALRRKGQRIAGRKRGGDDDQEWADQEDQHQKQCDRGEQSRGHRLFLAVAIRFRRILAAKLMTIRMKAMTLAETKLLATVTCW